MELVTDSMLHIPLRDGRPILIAGLPNDLTRAEAEKILRVLRALAQTK